MNRTRLVFSGSGGQGVITAAIILAEAAVIHEGMNATQSQSYGAAARGGATRSDIILSDEEINFPVVTQPNILVCLTQEAYTSFAPIIRPGGTLLTDSRFVQTTRKVDAKQIELPIYASVMDKIGKPIVFNISVLGALLGIAPLVREESLLAVIKAQIHAGGRGKGGGVKLVRTEEEAKAAAATILGMTLITHQTGPEGKVVKKLLAEAGQNRCRGQDRRGRGLNYQNVQGVKREHLCK